ncbi:centrosome-associated protein ALMS1 [Rhinophrynus dorsalis]
MAPIFGPHHFGPRYIKPAPSRFSSRLPQTRTWMCPKREGRASDQRTPYRGPGYQANPIATTPPISRFNRPDEALSQSSSPGTHRSSASGTSLGEAIRLAANQGMESWYQLPIEEDMSSFMPTISEMGAIAEQTEFPTLEEGTIHSEPEETKGHSIGRVHSLNLEIQDSRLSPCLPLLTAGITPGHEFFDASLYQQTETDFAPLSGTIDMSQFPGGPSKSLQMSDAMALAGKEVSLDLVSGNFTLSQHHLSSRMVGAEDASSLYCLSQHPLPFSSKDDEDLVEQSSNTITEGDDPKLKAKWSASSDEHVMSSSEELDRVFSQEDGSFLDSNLPAPLLLELLEKEIGISGSSDLSSRSSNSERLSTKQAEINDIPQDVESDQNLHHLAEPRVPNETIVSAEPLPLEEESFRDSSEIDFNATSFEEFEEENLDLNRSKRSNQSSITMRPAKSRHTEMENVDLKRSSRSNQSGITMRPPRSQHTKVENVDPHRSSRLNQTGITMPPEDSQHTEMENVDLKRSSRSNQSGITMRPSRSQHPKVENVDPHISSRSNQTGITMPPEDSQHTEMENVDSNRSIRSNQSVITIRTAKSQHSEMENVESNQTGITMHQTMSQHSKAVKDDLHKQLCSEIQQHYQERKLSKSSESRNEDVTLTALTKPGSEKENTVMEIHSSSTRDESTISSHCSIERGHQYTEISPDTNPPVEDVSFLGRLAHPISQSTPGMFAVKSVRNQLTDRLLQIKAKISASEMSLNEEPSNNIPKSNSAPFVKPQSLQSSQGYPESNDSERSSSPNRRRIQSLPSLNYIEKVGSWNTNMSFDALVLRGLTGMSPKKRAYNAVADSLNRMLSRQAGGNMSERGLAASISATTSMTNLIARELEPPRISQLTRSQSYNSVTTVSVENTSDKQTGSVIKPFKGTSDELVKTDKVAVENQSGVSFAFNGSNKDQTLKNAELSTAERPFECDEMGDQPCRGAERTTDKSPPKYNVGASSLTMDRFSDVSLDNDFLSSSHSSGRINSMHSLTSLEVDNFVPLWPPADQTPERKEINIEERIPTYLRNLGIDQSPTTILTPFAPKGPIREPEFSPSELRTIKGSTASPNRSTRLSEGGSQSAVNVSQSSLYSEASTTSVSIPMGSSEVGHDSPVPTEMSPQLSLRSSNDRPISQYDITSRQIESVLEPQPLQKCEVVTTETVPNEEQRREISITQSLPLDLQSRAEDSTGELNRVKQLVDRFESGNIVMNQNLQSAGSAESKVEGPLNMAPLSWTTVQKQSVDSINDSFVGSKTLKEIRKLLAEADNIGLDKSDNSLLSPLKDTYDSSPSQLSLKLEDSVTSNVLNIRSASPDVIHLKDMSWDASLHSSMTNDNLLLKGASVKSGSSDWDSYLLSSDPIKNGSYLEEIGKDKEKPAAPFKLQRHFGRAEPEGSSEAMTNKSTASNVQPRKDESGNIDGAGVGVDGRSPSLLSGVGSAVGGLEEAFAMSGAGYVNRREDVAESDDSSADSLAARVRTLLRSDTHLTRTTQISRSTEDDERRFRVSAKLKLANQPTFPETELNEEDRRRIEEIKRELLEGTKKTQLDPCPTDVDLREPGQSKEMDHLRLNITPIISQSGDKEPLDFLQTTTGHLAQFTPRENVLYNDEGSCKTDGTSKDVSYIRGTSEKCHFPYMFQQPEATADTHSKDYKQADNKGNDFVKQSPPSPSQIREKATKPITSITIASRKRSSPFPFPGGSEIVHPPQTLSGVQTQSYDRVKSDELFRDEPAKLIFRSNNESPVIPHQDNRKEVMDSKDVIGIQSPIPSSSEHSPTAHMESRQLLSHSAVLDRNASEQKWNSANDMKISPLIERCSKVESVALEPEIGFSSHDYSKVQSSTALEKDLMNVNLVRSSSYSTQKDDRKVGGDELNHSSPERVTSADRVNASSPTRKALSCIHVSISPKQDTFKKHDFVLDVPSVDVASESFSDSQDGILNADETLLPRADSTKLARTEQALNGQDLSLDKVTVPSTSSYFLHSPAEGTNRITNTRNESNVPFLSQESKRERTQGVQCRTPLYDAATQITTESPAKTTFSSEIFIDGREEDTISSPTNLKVNKTSDVPSSYFTPISNLSRATDQPLLVPYRPPGSPEWFYVPYTERTPKASPVSTAESSHTGSNDAVSPKFPSEVLGSVSDNDPDSVMLRHTEGIYSKTAGPRIAWEGGTVHQKPDPGFREDLELPKKTHPQTMQETQFGSYIKPSYTTNREGASQPEQKPRNRLDNGKVKAQIPSYQQIDKNEFFSLIPEADYSRDQLSNVNLPMTSKDLMVGSELAQAKNNSRSFPSTDVPETRLRSGQSPKNKNFTQTDFHRMSKKSDKTIKNAKPTSESQDSVTRKQLHKDEFTPSESTVSNQSLDDLWARFTERKKAQLSESSNKLELSLVERLDRLARLLQNPASRSLSSRGEQIDAHDQTRRKNEDREWRWGSKKMEGERWYKKDLVGFNQQREGGLILDKTEESEYPARRILQQGQYVDKTSDESVGSEFSPDVRSTETVSAVSESETATQTGSDVTTQTGVSGSISTIDTVRLIHAFGPERVRPSSKLSRLYNTIDLQKKRTEEGTRKLSRHSRSKEHPKRELTELQRGLNKITESSSVSTQSSSLDPKPAQKHKKSGKFLNKSVQAGDLEIVSSATKKNTRDVGTTFPSPGGETQRPLTEAQVHGHVHMEDITRSFLDQRGQKHKQSPLQGLSWFVPAENLKSDSRKENRSNMKSGPGPAWYEPLPSTKPWREPLREKNLQQHFMRRDDGRLNMSHTGPDSENKPLGPFVKVTLQESLQSHRPDFIFRSGERVKRLQLLAKERKLQMVFQSERDELFNHETKRAGNNYALQYIDYRATQRNRTIPKKEMVQRSRRIYEQLPEIKKKREDEKRRSEYESYRLKAQLFRKKVTNHVLGRKTPWN